MTEDRHVHEGSARRAPAHIHSHRALIGFDANGVPTVTHRADHCAEEDDPDAFIRDYNAAVAAYRKTFPTRDEVAEKTPDPAVREMLARAKSLGLETAFDRFDRQKPQCSFGLAGVCCKICNMGPCRVTTKSPRGVCGADADLIVSRNLLRSAAAGVAQHGMHAREVMLALKWAAEGKLDVPILGEDGARVRNRDEWSRAYGDRVGACGRALGGLVARDSRRASHVARVRACGASGGVGGA